MIIMFRYDQENIKNDGVVQNVPYFHQSMIEKLNIAVSDSVILSAPLSLSLSLYSSLSLYLCSFFIFE